MMLIAVLSAKGSPGVTTFSVALAARWPQPARALLVEADPSGGDIGMRFSLESTPGLVSLAAAARRSADPAVVWQHAQPLPGGLPVVSAPPDADRARAALSALAGDPAGHASPLRIAANAPDVVVIADCGRIDPGSAAMPVVRSADAMVLLTRAHSDALAHLARRLPAMGRWTPHPVMLLVGKGYSTQEVARELGVPPLARIPDDPRGAAVLCGQAGGSRWGRSSPARSALATAAHNVAIVLADHHRSSTQPRQEPVDHQAVPGAMTDPSADHGPASPLRVVPSTNEHSTPDHCGLTREGGQVS